MIEVCEALDKVEGVSLVRCELDEEGVDDEGVAYSFSTNFFQYLKRSTKLFLLCFQVVVVELKLHNARINKAEAYPLPNSDLVEDLVAHLVVAYPLQVAGS